MIKRIALTIGTRGLLTLVGLATSIATARFLGQTGRGEYFFAVTLAALISQFTNLGLPVSNTYFLAGDASLRVRLTANSLWVSIVCAGGVGVVIALIAPAIHGGASTYYWLAAALAPPTLFYLLGVNLLVGLNRIGTYNLLEACSRVGLLVAVVAAGVLGLSAAGFVAGAIVSWTAAAIAVGALLLRRQGIDLAFDRHTFRGGFRFGAKAYLVTFFAFVVLRSNIFILNHYYGSGELGLYSIAAQLSDVLSILPQSIALVIFPHLVKHAESRWTTTRRALLVTAVLMAAICLIAAAVAPTFIELTFGAKFNSSATVFRLMLPGVFFLALANILQQYLSALGMPRQLVFLWLGGAAAVLAISFVLVPNHAGAGAAVALSLTYFLIFIGSLILVGQLGDRSEGEPEAVDLESLPPAAE
jgi:O-antigen/teichoic acid export membrane protein